MKEKFGRLVIDLSLNRSLEELVASYWEAQYAGLDYEERNTYRIFMLLENYLYAIWGHYESYIHGG